MAQTIKIKRSTLSAAPTAIAAGELAYSKGSQTLYIGDPDTNNANTPLAIGSAIINNAGTVSRATGVSASELQQVMDTEVGVDVQAYDAGLTDIAGIAPDDNRFIVGNGSNWVAESTTVARQSLGLGALATRDNVGTLQIVNGAVTQAKLDTVTTPGTVGTFLRADAAGTMSWAIPTDTNVSVTNLVDRLDDINVNVTIGSGPTIDTTISGDLTVNGDLSVLGAVTSIETTEVRTEDNNITLNYGAGDTSATANGAGITIQDATSDATPVDAVLGWARGPTTDNFTMSHRLDFTSATEGDRGIIINGTQVIEGDGGYRGPNGTLVKPSISFDSSTGTGLHFDSTNTLLELGVNSTNALSLDASGNAFVNARMTSNTATVNNGLTTNTLSVLADTVGITLDADHATTARNSGTTEIQVERGTSPNAYIRYNHASSLWEHGVGSGVKTIGTITGITGGTGLEPDLEDVSGNVTLSLDFEELAAASTLVSTDQFIVLDDTVESRITPGNINVSLFNNDAGYGVGDITSVQISSTDNSISGTGTGTVGAISFDLEVDTIDGGTY